MIIELIFIFGASGAVAFIPLIIAFCIKKNVIKGILSGISFFGFVCLWIFSTIISLMSGIIGENALWLPFVLYLAVFIIAMLFLWKLFKAKTRVIIASSLAVVTVSLTAIFIIPVMYVSSIPVSTEEVFLPDYTPFGRYWYVDGVLTHHDSRAPKLNEPSTLKLIDDLPRLDGATALYPLYAAFAQATYPIPNPNLDIPEYFPYGDLTDSSYESLVVCSRTAGAFTNLVNGYADIVFLMGVSDEQFALAEEMGYELILTPIGREAFVFFVNSRNRVTDISEQNLKRIYTGEISNWNEVGGRNNEIRAYQRQDTSGSQVMLRQIMGDLPIAPVYHEEVFDTMMLMYLGVANYKNYRNALGYSFLYYIRDMINKNEVRFLSVNGVLPTEENIASGEYIFANDFYAVTLKNNGEYFNPDRAENIEKLLAWILSPQGRYLVEATGYVLSSHIESK